MIAPIVHLNGTSKEELLDQCSHALGALNEAAEALQRMHPNARDYYLHKEPGALLTAEAAHLDREHMLRRIKYEVYELFCAIENQGAKK